MLYCMKNVIVEGYTNFLGELRISVTLPTTGHKHVLSRCEAQQLFDQLAAALATPGCSDDEITAVDLNVADLSRGALS